MTPATGALNERAIQAEACQLQRYVGGRPSRLDGAVESCLKRLGFLPPERRCISGITPLAAIRHVAEHGVEAFVEETRYRGRRLAKLGLAPAAVIAALRESGEVAARAFAASAAALERYIRLRDGLSFVTILALNTTYHAVREAESRTFYDLFRVERDSPGLDAMLDGFCDALQRYTGASGARVYLRGDAECLAADAATVRRCDGPAALRLARLRDPQCYAPARRVLADAEWERRFAQCWAIPLRHEGDAFGLMVFGFPGPYVWLPRERELLAAAAERCGLAAERVRLCTELRHNERRIRELAGRVSAVEEHERRRISRELHDETGQSLLCLRLKLDMLETELAGALPEAAAKVADARVMCEHSITEVRRLIAALSPAVLEQMGLAAAIRQLAARFRDIHAAQVRLSAPRRLEVSQPVALAAYRLLQEVFNNIAKYSFATKVKISVRIADQYLRLRAEDNGIGFDVEGALSRTDCFGLSGMRERVVLLGGTFAVRSAPPGSREPAASRHAAPARTPGQGTVIDIALPSHGVER